MNECRKRILMRTAMLALTFITVPLIGRTAVRIDRNEYKEYEQPKPIHVTLKPHHCVPCAADFIEVKAPSVDNFVDDVNNSVNLHSYTDEQLEILAVIIYQEAGGDACSDDTRRKVGSVFINRVNSPLFPNTFEEVATAHKQYGTLYLTGIEWPARAARKEEAHAVERAYTIARELLTGGSIFPSNVIWQAQFPQGDGTYCYQDGIYFCYSEVNE